MMEAASCPEAVVVLSVTQARENLAELIDTTQRSGEPMVLTQAGRPVAVMLDHAVFARLVQAADEGKDPATLPVASPNI